MDYTSLSRIHHHMFEIDSTWIIIAVSATKLKGLYCFFGCHSNNEIHLVWLLLKNSIIPENLKRLCLWFSELQRKSTSNWFQYCSCIVIWASFPFKKWLSWPLPFRVLKRNISKTRRGIYKRPAGFVSFSLALSSQTSLIFWVNFPFWPVYFTLSSGCNCDYFDLSCFTNKMMQLHQTIESQTLFIKLANWLARDSKTKPMPNIPFKMVMNT